MVINISRTVVQDEKTPIFVDYVGPSLRVGDNYYVLVDGEVSVVQHNYFKWRYYTSNLTLENSEIENYNLEQVLSFYPDHLHQFIKINNEL